MATSAAAFVIVPDTEKEIVLVIGEPPAPIATDTGVSAEASVICAWALEINRLKTKEIAMYQLMSNVPLEVTKPILAHLCFRAP